MSPHSTQANSTEFLIVGGGIGGIATAWALAERGHSKVVLLEREAQLAAHSTAKNASILRTFTGEPTSTKLALETASFLADPPPGFSEVPLIDPVGLILIPEQVDRQAFEAWRSCKDEGAVVHLSEVELGDLAPHYRGATKNAFLVRDEGHIDNAALIDGMLQAARKGGVEVRTGCEVESFLRCEDSLSGVQLRGGQRIECDRVILAPGAWAHPLAKLAGSRQVFEARRRHLLVTAPQERVNARWPILWSETESFYVRPESGGLMICACDQDVVDPDRCEALPEVREVVARRSAACLPEFDDAPVAHFWAGMRTFSPTDEFVIGFDPQVQGLFWVAGLGGHGMSVSVGAGRLAASLLSD